MIKSVYYNLLMIQTARQKVLLYTFLIAGASIGIFFISKETLSRHVCEASGKEYLLLTGGKRHACVKKTSDPGKTCASKKDCQGYCISTTGRTGVSGVCSEYQIPKGCYEQYRYTGTGAEFNSLGLNGENEIFLCSPPETFRH